MKTAIVLVSLWATPVLASCPDFDPYGTCAEMEQRRQRSAVDEEIDLKRQELDEIRAQRSEQEFHNQEMERLMRERRQQLGDE